MRRPRRRPHAQKFAHVTHGVAMLAPGDRVRRTVSKRRTRGRQSVPVTSRMVSRRVAQEAIGACRAARKAPPFNHTSAAGREQPNPSSPAFARACSRIATGVRKSRCRAVLHQNSDGQLQVLRQKQCSAFH